MLNGNQTIAAMESVRNEVFAVIGKHELADHGGDPCLGTRASVVAYLAHCLGVRGELWNIAGEFLREYDVNCPDTACPHNAGTGDAV